MPKQPVCSEMEVGGRKQGFAGRPLKRLWFLELELLTSFEPFRESRQLWSTVPWERLDFLCSYSSSSGRKIMQRGIAALPAQLAPYAGNETCVTSTYSLTCVSTTLHSSASPSYDPCLRGTCDCGDNYLFIYLHILLFEGSESFLFDVILLTRIHYTFPKQVLCLL